MNLNRYLKEGVLGCLELNVLWFGIFSASMSFTDHCHCGQVDIGHDHHGEKHIVRHRSSMYSGQDKVR